MTAQRKSAMSPQKELVRITDSGNCYRIFIESNSRTDVKSIREGSGLSSLRKRLEQEGAAMEVICHHGVTLSLTLPKE